jgi:hypothetical protein
VYSLLGWDKLLLREKEKGGRPLINCPVGNFREEPDCRGGLGERRKSLQGEGGYFINLTDICDEIHRCSCQCIRRCSECP